MVINNNISKPAGSSQDARLPAALETGYFNVDEMSFEDLLAASVDFAESLKFYSIGETESGSWRSFLATNEIVIMALIVQRNIAPVREKITAGNFNAPRKLLPIALGLIADLNDWLKDLNRSDSLPARDLVALIQRLIYGSLLAEAHNVGVLLNYFKHADSTLTDIEFPQVSGIWEIPFGEAAAGSGGNSYRRALARDIDNSAEAMKLLTKSTFEFLNAIEHLKSQCKVLLPQSLKTQSHDPAISLFIAFLKLYRYAQDNVNSFTQRHLDYYYKDILRCHYREKAPETLVLNFEVPDGSAPVEIEAGRKFTCAKDKNFKDVLFETTESISVSDAKIGAIHTLNFTRETMITPECNMNFVTRIQRQNIPLNVMLDNQEQEIGWPLFGDSKVTTASPHRADHDAVGDACSDFRYGVAVASRVLMLEEGERKIILGIELDNRDKPVSFHLESLISANSRGAFKDALYGFALQWLRKATGEHLQEALSRETVDRIKVSAAAIDRFDPPLKQTHKAGDSVPATPCVTLFEAMLEQLSNSTSRSGPLLHRLLNADSKREFVSGLGEVVRYFLFESVQFPMMANKVLDSVARELNCKNSLTSVREELELGQERLFKKYLGSAFLINLSVENGWLPVHRYDVMKGRQGDAGFRLIFNISPEAPAICGCAKDMHGGNWDTALPILRLDLNPQASLNVFSLLERYGLEEVRIRAEVHGVRNVVVFNNISQLDPSKPFYPFGPTPSTNSYFALASPEAAAKHVDALRIHLHWGELPAGEEGFYGHYQGYPSKYRNQSFKTKLTMLSSGTWQPAVANQVQEAPLFASIGRKLSSHQLIDVESVEYLRPVNIDQVQTAFDLGLKTRSGFVKLALSSPNSGFGHQEYPFRLTETLEKNSKQRLGKKGKLPKMPYTPLLNKLSIDYIASTVIPIRSAFKGQVDEYAERVYRAHPFGVENIYPSTQISDNSFFKPFNADGNLLIGIVATDPPDRLNLYFVLSDDSVQSKSGKPMQHDWSYLGESGWVSLSSDRIVSDGTKGFLCSGIVTLTLPREISNQHPDMPGEMYWLRVSTNAASSSFCSLRQIKTHAVSLRRSEDEADFDYKRFPTEKLQWRPVSSIAGIDAVTQVDDFHQTVEAESRSQHNTRISERIRHRARAIASWDYERLILEKFPNVGKAVCFPNRSTTSTEQSPGKLLVVVMPRVLDPEKVLGKPPRLSAVHLNDIHEYLVSLSSPFAQIEVANPNYEWIQIRCAVAFEELARNSNHFELLNRDLGHYLNPFAAGGYGLTLQHRVKRQDIYSFIYNQDYVRFVTDFSMLHVTRDDEGYYRLGDSVLQEIVGRDGDVTPISPWSLLVPMKNHHFDVITEIEPRVPDVTGIRELEIGRTFIIGGI